MLELPAVVVRLQLLWLNTDMHNVKEKVKPGMVVMALLLAFKRLRQGNATNLRPARATHWVPGQSGLYRSVRGFSPWPHCHGLWWGRASPQEACGGAGLLTSRWTKELETRASSLSLPRDLLPQGGPNSQSVPLAGNRGSRWRACGRETLQHYTVKW